MEPVPGQDTGMGPPARRRLVATFADFADSEASSGVLLFVAAAVALIWANSAFADLYFQLWNDPLTLTVGGSTLSTSPLHVVNDALMAVFFLVVGLEIKRELIVGELASRSRAILPLGAAVGGAILPALIYIAIVGPGEQVRGWGIPMATDIAFALGVLAIVGSRIPLGLRVFVAAFAIVDDLIAVLVIALFYTSELNLAALAVAGFVFAALIAANLLGVRRTVVFVVLGVALWVAVYQSGVHATVAGVALAATIPSRDRDKGKGADADASSSPMLRMEHALQPWVAFLIVPLFALANAGVALPADVAATVSEPVVLGVAIGLLLGKQVGITTAAWLMVRTGIARLPDGVSWRHMYGAAWLGGIGFTMSLFIAELAFGGSSTLALAKIGILLASVIAGTGGFLVLRMRSGRTVTRGA